MAKKRSKKNPWKLYNKELGVAKKLGYSLGRRDPYNADEGSTINYKKKKIFLESSMSRPEGASTLRHEVGHAIHHARMKQNPRKQRRQERRYFEAGSVKGSQKFWKGLMGKKISPIEANRHRATYYREFQAWREAVKMGKSHRLGAASRVLGSLSGYGATAGVSEAKQKHHVKVLHRYGRYLRHLDRSAMLKKAWATRKKKYGASGRSGTGGKKRGGRKR